MKVLFIIVIAVVALASITVVANRRARSLATTRHKPESRSSTAVEFFLFFADEKAAHAAAAELQKLGYSVSARHVSSSNRWHVLAERHMAAAGAPSLEAQLREVAARFGGDYDGWSVAAS